MINIAMYIHVMQFRIEEHAMKNGIISAIAEI